MNQPDPKDRAFLLQKEEPMKRFLGAVLAVTAVIFVIDMILHNVILMDAYNQTLALWRPEAEMKNLFWLIWAGYPVFALFFVWMFAKGYEKDKPGLGQGLRFGILSGLLVFAAQNMMCYAVMPLPVVIPVAWFLGGLVECIAGGIVAGMIYKR
jgi:hypothetical protein